MGQDLSGKVAAVTGAASGIGLECAKALLAAGVRVVLVDRNEEALREICSKLDANAIPLVIDLTDPKSVERMMPEILEKNRPTGYLPRQCRLLYRRRSAGRRS